MTSQWQANLNKARHVKHAHEQEPSNKNILQVWKCKLYHTVIVCIFKLSEICQLILEIPKATVTLYLVHFPMSMSAVRTMHDI